LTQLQHGIDGIPQKVLSHTLQKLGRDGLVNRNAFLTVPSTAEYSITKLGKTLSKLLEPLMYWA